MPIENDTATVLQNNEVVKGNGETIPVEKETKSSNDGGTTEEVVNQNGSSLVNGGGTRDDQQPIIVPSDLPIVKKTDGNASFLRAARAGNLDKVLEFLKTNTDINTCNSNGLNALHLASKEGHAHVVSFLIERKANVDAATKKGNTALHISSLAGQEDIVRVLVENNASVNIQSQNGFTPLYMAAQENHDSVVKFLLSNGANQSLATMDGFTPLAVALQQGHDRVVAVLLENDTRGKVRLPALHIAAKKDDTKAATLLLHSDHNPDVTSKSGFTPLHIASHYGNDNVAALLIQRRADVNFVAKHQITPLHVASKWGKESMVSLLIEKGANIESKTRDGLTPLHCAARSGHEKVVDMLLEKGAPITAKTKNGLAPLHMASQGDHVDAARILLYHKAPVDDVTVDFLTALHVAAHCGHVRVAKLLLDRKADPNSRALNGFTPLHIACKKNRIKVVELLLKHGASIEATTESGLTPLHVSSFMGCMNIVIYLIQHGASADVPTVRGETPLHLAARANQTDIIRILLRNGAQVDAKAREQQTALHIASRLGNSDIVVLLLQHGATVDAATKDSYTPLHIAAKEGQEEVASVLMEHGASLSSTTKKGFTPLHLSAKYGNMKVARLLLQKDAAVDPQGKNGVTPLHVAAHYDHQNVALLLLDKGASPQASAKNGYTPLHIAARKNQMDIATTLLEYGASSNSDSRAGFTPLHLSAQEGHSDMSTLLIEHGATAGLPSKNGLTPLHLCSQEDRVTVAAILVKNGADVDHKTKAGYTPLHVASHFGQINMVKFLLQHGTKIDVPTQLGYTSLHQAAQQGHSQVVNLLLDNKAEPNMTTNEGKTALSIAEKLGYISVVETLKIITETRVTTSTTTTTEEKYKVVVPESMHETFMSESEDEGADDTMLGDQSYRYLTVDEMKVLGDDSLTMDVTRDEKMDASFQSTHLGSAAPEKLIAQHKKEQLYAQNVDNVDVVRPPILAGPESLNATMNTTEEPLILPIEVPDGSLDVNVPPKDLNESTGSVEAINGWEQFLVSFMVDARGGAMRGCRHSGVRVIIPPRKAAMPMRITCRYLKRDKLVHAPPLMEGEALASRILEMGPSSAKFLGPVIIEVPHFASLRSKEREIVILRSDNGETWREHTLEATEEAVQEVLNESFDGEELKQLEDLNTNRITRVLTNDFPQYFAIVTRIRQEVHAIGTEGGMVSSTVVPQVQAVFPHGALTKKIKVGLQAQPISPDLVAKLLGNRVAVSPIVTVEPRRRKFHKPITLTIPVPQAASKGMINQYSGDAPTLRLLCSITGGTTRAQWEDVTGSTNLTFVNDCVSFTTTVSARFWLMDCTNIPEATKMATELYREAIHVPFMAKFVVFSKRHQLEEARVRVFCMTDDKEDKTLEVQENFIEVAKSRDVEVLEGKAQFLEFAGNLVPVTKSGDQLAFNFYAFRENRLPFTVRVKDQSGDPVGRVAFMRQPKVGRGDPPQTPICNLNLSLPENVQPEPAPSEPDLLALEKKYTFLSITKPETIHKADLRLSDISNMLTNDWVALAKELEIGDSDINIIKSQYPNNIPQQAIVMLRLWMQTAGNKATGNTLEMGLRAIGRVDIVNECICNLEVVTDDHEKAMATERLKKLSTDDQNDLTKKIETKEQAEEQIIKENGSKKPVDRSPTYESEEKKYAAEEKIVKEQIISSSKKLTKEKHVKEEKKSDSSLKEKKTKIFKDDSKEKNKKDGKKSPPRDTNIQVEKEVKEEKFLKEIKTIKKEHATTSAITSAKKSSSEVSCPKEQKQELLQKLGEELGKLDEKLEEKFKKKKQQLKETSGGITQTSDQQQMEQGASIPPDVEPPFTSSTAQVPHLKPEHGIDEPLTRTKQQSACEDVGVVFTECKQSGNGENLSTGATGGHKQQHITHDDSRHIRRHERNFSQATNIITQDKVDDSVRPYAENKQFWESVANKAPGIKSETESDTDTNTDGTIVENVLEERLSLTDSEQDSSQKRDLTFYQKSNSSRELPSPDDMSLKDVRTKKAKFEQEIKRQSSELEESLSWKRSSKDSDDLSDQSLSFKEEIKDTKETSSKTEKERVKSVTVSEDDSSTTKTIENIKKDHRESSETLLHEKITHEKIKDDEKVIKKDLFSKEDSKKETIQDEKTKKTKSVTETDAGMVIKTKAKEISKSSVIQSHEQQEDKSKISIIDKDGKEQTVTREEKHSSSTHFKESTSSKFGKTSLKEASKLSSSDTTESNNESFERSSESAKESSDTSFSQSDNNAPTTSSSSSKKQTTTASSVEDHDLSDFTEDSTEIGRAVNEDEANKFVVKKVEEERRTIGDTEEVLVREITTTQQGGQEQRVVKETKTQATLMPDGSTVKTTSVTTFTTQLDRKDSEDRSEDSLSSITDKEKSEIFLKKQIKGNIATEGNILSPEEPKVLKSPIHVPEEGIQDVVWEVSQEQSEIPEAECVQFLDQLSHQDSTESKRSDLQRKIYLSEDEARVVATEIVEEVKNEALKRPIISTPRIEPKKFDEMSFLPKPSCDAVFTTETSDKIEKYIQQQLSEEEFDEQQINLIESVAAKKAEMLQKRLGACQMSVEITDEDLKSSGAELSPIEHHMERLRQMTEEEDQIKGCTEPSEADESEGSMIIHDSLDENFSSGYDQANQMFNKTLDTVKSLSIKSERLIDTISEEVPDEAISTTRKKSREEVEETAKQIVKSVTEKAQESEALKFKSDSKNEEIRKKPPDLKVEDERRKKIKDDLLKQERSFELQMESSMTESVEECSAAESSRAYDVRYVTEMARSSIKEEQEQEKKSSPPGDEVKLRKKSHIEEFNRRSITDFDTYSSSGESHYYTAGEGTDSRSVSSRPCSSDIDVLLSITPGSSEYDTALTSQEGSQSSHIHSRDFSTAPSSLSSRDSMKSIDSESSGHLASIELSSEVSETLVPSSMDLERDMELLDQEILEEEEMLLSKISSSGITQQIIHSSTQGSDDIPVETSVINVGSKMKRSMEMTFHPEPKPLATEDEEHIQTVPIIDKNIYECSTNITETKKSDILATQADVKSSKEEKDSSKTVTMASSSIPSRSTQVSSETKDSSFFRIKGPTGIKTITKRDDGIDWRPDVTSQMETAGGHSMGPDSSESCYPEADQHFTRESNEIELDFDDKPESDMHNGTPLNYHDIVERPKTPEPGSASSLMLQEEPENMTEVDKQFSAVFSHAYEEPDSPLKKTSTSSVPDIKVTEHLAPLDDQHRYPDLECEFLEIGSQSSPSSVTSPKSSTTDSDHGREYCLDSQTQRPVLDGEYGSFEVMEARDIDDDVEYQQTITCHEERLKNIVKIEHKEEDSPVMIPSTIRAIKLDTLSPSSSDSQGELDKSYDESAYSSSIEEQRRWLELQFEENTNKNTYEYPQQSFVEHIYSGPLEDIEEERDEYERRDMAHLTKTSSLSSTPDFDVLAGKKFFTKGSTDHDDVSMSSLTEFECLENAVAIERRSSSGSQESLNGKRPGSAGKSGGDDVSVGSFSSLKEFERLELECVSAESIEVKAKLEEQILSEIEEGHESQVSESESCETLSEAEQESPENYEQKMFEIDEIIRQAQTNVEQFEHSAGVSLQDIAGASMSADDRTPSAEPPDSLEEPLSRPGKSSGYMTTSVDSIEGKSKKADIMTGSIDSIESARRDYMATSIDSLGCEADISSGSEMLSKNPMEWSTDSLEPTSSQATHAMYQFETDSMMSGSFASGCSNTLIQSYDDVSDLMNTSMYIPEGELPEDPTAGRRYEWTQTLPKGLVSEVIVKSTEPECSTITSQTVAFPPEVKQVTFSGPNAQKKLNEFIEKFDAGEHTSETETVDSAGNVHIQKIVQKRIILSPHSAQEKGLISSEPEQQESVFKDEHGNVTKVVRRTVISTENIDLTIGQSTESSIPTTTSSSTLHPCGPPSGLHSSCEPLPTSLEPNTASDKK